MYSNRNPFESLRLTVQSFFKRAFLLILSLIVYTWIQLGLVALYDLMCPCHVALQRYSLTPLVTESRYCHEVPVMMTITRTPAAIVTIININITVSCEGREEIPSVFYGSIL